MGLLHRLLSTKIIIVILLGWFIFASSMSFAAKTKSLHTPGVQTVHDVRQQLICVTQKILQTEYAIILADEALKISKEYENKALS